VVFPIPDCICPFKKSGWGHSAGGLVAIDDVAYWLAARLIAKPPKRVTASLRRSDSGLEFLHSTGEGEQRVGYLPFSEGYVRWKTEERELFDSIRKGSRSRKR